MGARRGTSAERIAEELLRERGFEIEASRHVVIEDGEKIAEVDFLATESGTAYAVEVKAGGGDVQAVRQAYANAHLVDREPLLVCKQLAEEARVAAAKLGVRVFEVATFYPILEAEELEILIRGALEETFERYGFLLPPDGVEEEDRLALGIIARAESPEHAAELLGVPFASLGDIFGRLKNRHLLPRRSLAFREVARAASAILARVTAQDRIANIEDAVARLERAIAEATEPHADSFEQSARQ